MQVKKPPYLVKKPREDYLVYYFQVPPRLRPDGWDAAINLGRDDQETLSAIYAKAWALKDKLDKARIAEQLGKGPAPRHKIGSIPDVVDKYRKSEFYKNLRPATRDGYDYALSIILEWSKQKNDPHVKLIEARHVYKLLATYSEKKAMQRLVKAVIALLLNTAVIAGYVQSNVAKSIALPRQRKERTVFKLWDVDAVEKFIKAADELNRPNVGTAVLLAFDTGQRQTDVFNFQKHVHFKDGRFSFVQSKTGEPVDIPATARTLKRMATIPKEQLLLTVHDATKKKWDRNSFNKAFRKVCKKAELEGYSFRKIRNSLTVHGERAGMDDAEFHSVFGWSRATVKQMKDQHYGSADQEVADRGISKIQDYRDKAAKKAKKLDA